VFVLSRSALRDNHVETSIGVSLRSYLAASKSTLIPLIDTAPHALTKPPPRLPASPLPYPTRPIRFGQQLSQYVTPCVSEMLERSAKENFVAPTDALDQRSTPCNGCAKLNLRCFGEGGRCRNCISANSGCTTRLSLDVSDEALLPFQHDSHQPLQHLLLNTLIGIYESSGITKVTMGDMVFRVDMDTWSVCLNDITNNASINYPALYSLQERMGMARALGRPSTRNCSVLVLTAGDIRQLATYWSLLDDLNLLVLLLGFLSRYGYE
jgi:hypothetical protein